MGFRFRLASFLVAALVTVQLVTGVLVYSVTRRQLIEEGKRQLGAAAHAFARQLDDLSARVAASVQVLSLDYALRSAIAQRDAATLQSALENHGRRVGAVRMQLVDLDGRVEADTLAGAAIGAAFPYRDLLDAALERASAAVVAWQGRAYWVVVVPVFAPDLIGTIAATLPVDDPLLARLREQAVLPKTIELVGAAPDGRWTVLASGSARVPLTEHLTAAGAALPTDARLVTVGGREYLAQAVWLVRSQASPPVAAVLAFSVDEALEPYRPVATAWAALLALGLVAGVAGAFLIARRVSRPVEALAVAARRIEAGDYGAPPAVASSDEIGALASAFASMTRAIRERELRILHQAGHDPVTGLPNRTAAAEAIGRERGVRGGEPAALLVVGLRRVPEIVKTMGHAVADRVMQAAGDRLRQAVGFGLLARATDTELAVYLPGHREAEALAAARRYVEVLAVPYREADLSLDLAPAVGVALAPLHGNEADVLLRRASVALLAAFDGEEAAVVYDPATDPHRPERLSLLSELRVALDRGELELHYQPKLNLASGAIDAAEGLVRWRHARLGNVPPDAFIALAEETGNIRRLTRWAVEAGIVQARRWNVDGRTLRVGVNVSARDLDDAELPHRVEELLARHGVAPRNLLLEVTESAVMARPEAAIAVLRALAELGVDLAIDDFGVGQSSFAYLRQLPVRELKIDRLFVRRIGEVPADRAIVRSIVDLGHHLGVRVTAEGVEEPAALDWLAGIGCDHAQGWAIARPLRAEDFERLLATHVAAPPGSRVDA